MRYTLGYVRSFSSKKHRFGTKKCVCAAAHSRLRPADGLVRRSLLRQTSVLQVARSAMCLTASDGPFRTAQTKKRALNPRFFVRKPSVRRFACCTTSPQRMQRGRPFLNGRPPVWCLRNELAGAASLGIALAEAALRTAPEAVPRAARARNRQRARVRFRKKRLRTVPSAASVRLRKRFRVRLPPARVPKGLYATFGASSARAIAFS